MLYSELWAFGWMRRLSKLTCQMFFRITLTHMWFWTVLNCSAKHQTLFSSRVRYSRPTSHTAPSKGWLELPHGALTFVSSLYEGAISDREILKQSGIVSLLKPTMAIMVDKGFLVEDFIPCKVHIPTFLSKRAQLSGPEVRKTQSIARLRVHVERLIRRVKEHKIFNTVIPLSLTGSIRLEHLYCHNCDLNPK